jgi:glycosyltransferase involved in cell wall biosynthesis
VKVVFVNRFYWPEIPATGQLLTDLAQGLAARDWEVSVITSAAHPDVPRLEQHHGVTIHRVGGTRWARGGTSGKAIDFGTFFLGATRLVFRQAGPGTILVPMTDPPLLGVGVGFVAACRGAGTVHWIQDIYPEVAIALLQHSWLGILRPLRNLAWRKAAACVTVGRDMTQAMIRAAVSPERVHVAPNWAPAGVVPLAPITPNALRKKWGLDGKFVVAYSGNLGRVHDLDPIIDLAEALRTDLEVVVVFIGDGVQRLQLETAARARSLANVAFFPPQPRDRLSESLALGDLHLVTLRPGCEGYVFPSKLYGIAAAGRPILFVGPPDCDVASTVREHDLGQAFARENTAGLAAAVRRLASDRAAWSRHSAAALAFAAQHTAARAVDRWHHVLATVARTPSG